MAAVMVVPAVTLAGTLAKVTTPVALSYVPAPKTGLVMTTPLKPGVSCKVNVGLTALLLALRLAKLTVPLTLVPTGALAGSCTVVAMSAAKGVVLALLVLLVGLVSLAAPTVLVAATVVLGWV